MLHAVDRKGLRPFGLLVGGIFAVMGLWPILVGSGGLRLWGLGLGVGFIVPALCMPALLRPVHRLWMAVGELMGCLNTRLILGLVFFGICTPMGLIMRLVGQDPLRRQRVPEAETYRVTRRPRSGSHMQHQF
jgi:hypothetical protein